MIYLALSNLALVALAVFLVLENRHAVAVVESVARSGSPDLMEMVGLVDRLCQRVQAPAVAVAEHAMMAAPAYVPQHVPVDDDDAHWESKEQLAERLAGEALSGAR